LSQVISDIQGERMFELTLVDHLRLTFGHVVYRHKTHSQFAHERARRSRWLKAIEAALMAAVVGTATATALGKGQIYATLTAVFGVMAAAALLVDLTLDFGRSAQMHAWCASRLWLIREEYRALLADLADGAFDIEAARHRRDALMHELHAIYASVPPAEAPAYQAAARAIGTVDEAVLTDEEIETFIRKASKEGSEAA
jgi:hypothetical protein